MFKSRILLVAIFSVFALTMSETLLAPCPGCSERAVALHPQSFGKQTRTNWKANQGLTDNNPNTNQALYFQKMVPTATFAAALASIHGFDGAAPSNITQLQWKRKLPPMMTDENCTGGAADLTTPSPRWSFRIRLASAMGGGVVTKVIGCKAATTYSGGTMVEATGTGTETGWIIHTAVPNFASDATLAGATLLSVAIIYDDGDAAPMTGFVFLDDIAVTGTTNQNQTGTLTWKSAADNGTN